MGITVVSDDVSLPGDLTGDVRIFLDVMTHHKKSGLDIGLSQGLEDFWRPQRRWPVIEGKRDLFLAGLDAEDGPPAGKNSLVEKDAKESGTENEKTNDGNRQRNQALDSF